MKTKSGMESPAGYNTDKPASGDMKAPTKIYPGSHGLASTKTKGGLTIDSPCKDYKKK